MKRSIILIAAVLAAIVCLTFVFMVSAAPSSVYVSQSGDDANTGSSSSPVKTIEKAFELMPGGGKIILCGETYDFGENFSMPKSDKKYTLTSQTTKHVKFKGTFTLNSDFLIENIKFNASGTPIFVGNGHNVTYGKGIENATNTYIVGGANLTADSTADQGNFTEDYTIQVLSGKWVNFFGGNRRATGAAPVCTISADITVIVDGAVFKKTGTKETENHCNISGMNGVTGDNKLIIKSGEIWGSIYGVGRIGTGGSSMVYGGSTTIQILGGTYRNLATDSNLSKGNGVMDACQDIIAKYNGDFRVEIADKADISLRSIKTTGVKGKATLDVASKVVDLCSGFERTVYVDGVGGSDTNGGTTKADAYKTFDRAVNAVSTNGGEIIVCGNVTVDKSFAEAAKGIIVTSVKGNKSYKNSAKLTVTGAVDICSDVTFENIKLTGDGTLFANTHTLILSESVECDGNLNVSASSSSGDSSVGGQAVLCGGKYNVASAGSVGDVGAASVSNTSVSIEGATVNILTVGTKNNISGSALASIVSGTVKNGAYGVYYDGDVNVTGNATLEFGGGKIYGEILAVSSGVKGECEGNFTLALMDADVSEVTKISGTGFATSVGKAKAEDMAKLEGFDTVTKEVVVYVCDGGTGDGSTPDKAIGSLGEAYEKLAGVEGTIVICGPTTIGDFKAPRHENEIKIVSRYAGVDYRRSNLARLIISEKFTSGGPVTFDDMVVFVEKGTKVILANSYDLTMGAGVTCENVENGGYPYIFGGSNEQGVTTTGANITINGGTWQRIIGGNRYSGTKLNGDIKITVNGGTVMEYVGGSGSGSVTGNISITINGGLIRYGVYAISCEIGDFNMVEGNMEITINDGIIKGKVCASRIDEYCGFNGIYILYINGGDLSSVTDFRGSVNIKGKSVSDKFYGPDVSYTESVEGTVDIKNPISAGADPWVIYHDGYYYMALAAGDSVWITKALNLGELGEAEAVKVWTPSKNDGLSTSIWSPELHYFSADDFGEEHAGWYLYVAVTPYSATGENMDDYRRCYSLKALTDDPQGEWGNAVGEKGKADHILTDKENAQWAIGPSIIRIDGKIYMTWTGREFVPGKIHRQSLNIGELKNPYTIDLDKAGAICWPTEPWEKYGATYPNADGTNTIYPEVVEGATAVYGKNGEIYIIYSASGYWTDYYALAQLKYTGGDPTNINNWQKSPQPIFKQNSNVYGPGHASYTVSPDGGTCYFVYHGYKVPGRVGGRYVYVETYTVDENGVHLGSGTPASPNVPITTAKNPMPLAIKMSLFGDSSNNNKPGGETQPGGDAPVAPDPQPKKSNPVLIVCIIVAIVAVSGIAVFFVIKKKKVAVGVSADAESENTDTTMTDDNSKE